MSSATPFKPATRWIRPWLIRGSLFAFIWWVLTDSAIDSWPVGVPVVLIATLVSVKLLPPVTWSLVAILRFIPFFLWHSLRGGVDVAKRVLDPQLPIYPGLYEHSFRLPVGMPRVFMANIVSLLPGSLSVELDDKKLRIHVLDENGNFAEELKVLETQLANIFRLELE